MMVTVFHGTFNITESILYTCLNETIFYDETSQREKSKRMLIKSK